MTDTDDELARASRADGFDCPFCWGTGWVMFEELHDDGYRAVPRPCPEGCLAPGEVPY